MTDKKSTLGYNNKLNYIQDYNKTAYDNLHIRVKKGMKDEYKAAADSMGMSLAGLVAAALDEYIQQHKK
jgi:predicted HicB family RNase H-like nuclease